MSATPVDRLTMEQRSCLLRAARTQLLVLKDEHSRLTGMDATSASDSALVEVRCLEGAISWLWRDQARGGNGG